MSGLFAKQLLFNSDGPGVLGWNASSSSNFARFTKKVTDASWGTADMDFSNIYGGCYGRKGFVVVGDGPKILHSTDGLSWAQRTCPNIQSGGYATYLKDVCWDEPNGRYLAIGYSSSLGSIITSTDGINWSILCQASGGYGYQYSRICAGGGKIVTTNGYYNAVSSDGGSTWSYSTNSRMATAALDVRHHLYYQNGYFVTAFTGRLDGTVRFCIWASSSDGLTWDMNYLEGETLLGLCAAKNRFIMFTMNVTGKGIYYSSDGSNWTEAVTFSTTEHFVVTHDTKQFVFVGTNGNVITSKTGIDNFSSPTTTNVTNASFFAKNNLI